MCSNRKLTRTRMISFLLALLLLFGTMPVSAREVRAGENEIPYEETSEMPSGEPVPEISEDPVPDTRWV